MSERRSLVIPLAGGCLAVLLLLLWLVLTGRTHDRQAPPADRAAGPTVASHLHAAAWTAGAIRAGGLGLAGTWLVLGRR